MKKSYTVEVERKAAALYLVWEWGFKRGNEILRTMPKSGTVNLTGCMGRGRECHVATRKAAEERALHISKIAAYQNGRLGRPAQGFVVLVQSAY